MHQGEDHPGGCTVLYNRMTELGVPTFMIGMVKERAFAIVSDEALRSN